MKIYRLKFDVNHFQFFLPADQKVWSTDLLLFDGTPRADTWAPPEVYVYKPKLKRGNFFCTTVSNALICDQTAYDALREILERAGEVLPLPHQGEMFHLLNVTECINVLDQERTQWRVTEGVRTQITKYAFHRDRMSESSLFKIPETARGEILTYEGLKDPEDEFKPRVEQLGLKGLLFTEVWSDEQG